MILSIIHAMGRFSAKLLAYFTALLMAFSPLQAEATSVPGSFELRDHVIQHSASLVEDASKFADLAPGRVGDHCEIDQGCVNYSCTSGQCNTCTMLSSPVFVNSVFPFAGLVTRRPLEGIARLFSDSLLRPPG